MTRFENEANGLLIALDMLSCDAIVDSNNSPLSLSPPPPPTTTPHPESGFLFNSFALILSCGKGWESQNQQKS